MINKTMISVKNDSHLKYVTVMTSHFNESKFRTFFYDNVHRKYPANQI